MRGSVSPNLYIALANMMMRFLVAVVFNFITTYLVLSDNVYKKKKSLGQKPDSLLDYYHRTGENLIKKS